MPGSLCRFGPAKETGEARIDHTGSTRMFRSRGLDQPADVADKRQPHLVAARRAAAACRCAGSAPNPASSARCRSVPNCQRSTSPSDFGGTPSGSKKCRAVEMVGDGAVIGFHLLIQIDGTPTAAAAPASTPKTRRRVVGMGDQEGRERTNGIGRYMACPARLGTCGERKPPRQAAVRTKLQLSQCLPANPEGISPQFLLDFHASPGV